MFTPGQNKNPVDFLYANSAGNFICIANKNSTYVTIRNNFSPTDSMREQMRFNFRHRLEGFACGRTTPYMVVHSETEGCNIWLMNWDIEVIEP